MQQRLTAQETWFVLAVAVLSNVSVQPHLLCRKRAKPFFVFKQSALLAVLSSAQGRPPFWPTKPPDCLRARKRTVNIQTRRQNSTTHNQACSTIPTCACCGAHCFVEVSRPLCSHCSHNGCGTWWAGAATMVSGNWGKCWRCCLLWGAAAPLGSSATLATARQQWAPACCVWLSALNWHVPAQPRLTDWCCLVSRHVQLRLKGFWG